MNIGEILVKFGADVGGLMGGLQLVTAAFGLFSGASKTAGSGLANIASQIAATEARLVSLRASAAAMNGTMAESSAVVNGLKLAFVALIAVIAIVAAAAIGIGVISVKMAADFQQGMARLVTGAGDVTDNMKAMGQSILGISVATGVLTGQLLPAMYQIISAGQRGAQAQDTLRVAAMGSGWIAP